MRRVIVVLAILSVLTGCTSPRMVTPAPASQEPSGELSLPASEELAQEDQTSSLEQAGKQASLTVAVDHFGIRDTHWVSQVGGEAHARVQFIVVMSDVNRVLSACTIPPEGVPGLEMDYFQVNSVKDYTSPEIYSGLVTEDLTIYVAAYNVNKGPITMDVVSQWMDMPELTALKAMVPDKELIGYYVYTWSPQDDWGIGRHDEQGEGDLLVWYRIGNSQILEPAEMPVLAPNITIENVSLPDNVKVRQPSETFFYKTWPFTFTIANHEPMQLTFTWRLESTCEPETTVGGVIYPTEGQVTIPGDGKVTIQAQYWFTKAGTYDWEYVVEYPEGIVAVSWESAMKVAP
jgi:hypothetical protein